MLLSIDEIEGIEGEGREDLEEVEPEEIAGQVDGHAGTATPGAISRAPAGQRADPSAVPARGRSATRRWLFRSAGAAGGITLAVGALMLAGTPRAQAAAAGQRSPDPAVIRLTGTDSSSGLRLAVTLTDSHGAPISHATVLFFQWTTEFNPSGQLVPLGSATTDRSGVARLTDQPAVTGVQRFTVTYADGPVAGQASASAAISVTTARSPYQPSPGTAFAGIGKAVAGVLLAAVVLILLTLLAQVERVRRACRAGG